VAGACGKMLSPLTPLYKYVEDTLNTDVEQLVSIFSNDNAENCIVNEVSQPNQHIQLLFGAYV
jgi:hypothetical protein